MAKPASAEQKAETAAQRGVEQGLEREKARAREGENRGAVVASRRVRALRVGVFGVFSGISLLAALRSAFPRVLFQPPTWFKAGFPSDFTVGEVSTKFQKDQRVWIVREAEGIYAIFAICTHLGCTPRWLAAENKFKCPCHGSGFARAASTSRARRRGRSSGCTSPWRTTGSSSVDKGVKFRYEMGEWGKPGSILKV